MNIFGIGLPEMGLIMIVALLVFGPKKLPEIGRSMGKALKGFQDASKEFENEFKKEAERLEKTVAEPMKATLEIPRALAPDVAEKDVEKAPEKTPEKVQAEPSEAEIEAEIVEAANSDTETETIAPTADQTDAA